MVRRMDLSFLAPPDEVADWRRVVLSGLAFDSGVLEHLPGSPADIATALGLDDHSVRVLLEALALWQVVSPIGDAFEPGPNMPDRDEALTLMQHARFLRRWSTELSDRMDDRISPGGLPNTREGLTAWLGALAARARVVAPTVIDACVARRSGGATALDVAAGHGEYGIELARRGYEVTLLDVPDVIDTVSDWPTVRAADVELVAGDVFEVALDRQFDLVLCFGFSHTQPTERCPVLFERLAELTAPGGSIAVHTFLRGDDPVASLFAVQMLLAGRGGDSHTLDEYRRWTTDAGFESLEVVDLGHRALLLAHKPAEASRN